MISIYEQKQLLAELFHKFENFNDFKETIYKKYKINNAIDYYADTENKLIMLYQQGYIHSDVLLIARLYRENGYKHPNRKLFH